MTTPAQSGQTANPVDSQREINPRVFISYSHDSAEHRAAVLEFAKYLRNQGIAVAFDQDVESPEAGWPRWMHHQIRDNDYVLMICTPRYKRRVEGDEAPGVGLGGVFEGYLIYDAIHRNGTLNEKFIPLLPSNGSAEDVPDLLRGVNHYRLDDNTGLAKLVDRIVKRATAVEANGANDASRSAPHTASLLSVFPPSPLVPAHVVPFELYDAFTKSTPSQFDANAAFTRAIALRLEDDDKATVPSLGDVPQMSGVGTFWQQAFIESGLHGPRMVAALLLSVNDKQFNDKEQTARSKLIRRLRKPDWA